MIPRLSRFLIGFCVTPFVLGCWMLLRAAGWPGAPGWLFLVPPSLVALALIMRYGPRTLRRLAREHRRMHKLSRNPWLAYFICACAAFLVCLVLSILVRNGQAPIMAHDALVYLGEALPFAQERATSAVNDFRGQPNGSLMGDVHNFLFPAYLGHALLTTGQNPLGYPNDYAARAAFQVTFIYMLLSVVALARTARYLGSGALALILLLLVPQFEYVSIASSRDAFRIIPLLLLTTVLAGLSPQRLRCGLRPAALLPPMVLAAFSLSGHTLGGVVVVCIALAWLAWNALQRSPWLGIVLVLAAVCAGLLLSGLHYLEAFRETGQLWGNVPSRYAVQGTALETVWPQREQYRVAAESTVAQRLSVLLERDRYRLSVPGVAGALLVLLLWARLARNRRARSIPFLGLAVLTVALPFTGVLDAKVYRLSTWFLSNFRYALHWYPFAAACVAMQVCTWYEELSARDDPRLRRSVGVVLAALAAVVTFSAHRVISSQWRVATLNEEWISDSVGVLEIAARQLPAGKKLLIEDARYTYYLDRAAVLMYSRPTWEVIRATSEREVHSALAELSVGAVALQEAEISGWWDQIPLFDFLSNPQTAYVSARNSDLRVYLVDETLVRRQGEADAAAASRAMQAAFLDLDFCDISVESGKTYSIAKTGQRLEIEGAVHVVDGPWEGAHALVVEEGTENVIPNPSFEVDMADWAFYSGPSTIAWSDDRAYSGAHSIKVAGTNSAGAMQTLAGRSTAAPASEGDIWTASAYVWIDSGSDVTRLSICLEFLDAGQAVIGTLCGLPDSDGLDVWQRVTVTATAPADTAFVCVLCPHVEVGESDSVLGTYDAIQLEKKPYATTYCDGDQGDGYAWGGTPHDSISSRVATLVTTPAGGSVDGRAGSISVWWQPGHASDVETYRYLFDLRDGTTDWGYVYWDHRYDAYYFSELLSAPQGFSAGEWQHVVVTWEPGSRKIYVNGLLEGADSVSQPPLVPDTLYVGSRYSNSCQADGAISQFVAFRRALDADEVAALFRTGGPTGRCR